MGFGEVAVFHNGILNFNATRTQLLYTKQKADRKLSAFCFIQPSVTKVDWINYFLGALPVVPKQKATLPGNTIPHSVPGVSGVEGTNL